MGGDGPATAIRVVVAVVVRRLVSCVGCEWGWGLGWVVRWSVRMGWSVHFFRSNSTRASTPRNKQTPHRMYIYIIQICTEGDDDDGGSRRACCPTPLLLLRLLGIGTTKAVATAAAAAAASRPHVSASRRDGIVGPARCSVCVCGWVSIGVVAMGSV